MLYQADVSKYVGTYRSLRWIALIPFVSLQEARRQHFAGAAVIFS